MRRLTWILPMVLSLHLMACKRASRPRIDTVEEQQPGLTSRVQMADPAASPQLLKGFHEIEHGGWRWTKGQFSMTLKPPPGSATTGATLNLKLSVPDPVFQKLGPVTLSASAGGIALEPQKFDKPGQYSYERPLAASALGVEAVTVDFALDKFLAAGQVELRELGVIVTEAGLTAR